MAGTGLDGQAPRTQAVILIVPVLPEITVLPAALAVPLLVPSMMLMVPLLPVMVRVSPEAELAAWDSCP